MSRSRPHFSDFFYPRSNAERVDRRRRGVLATPLLATALLFGACSGESETPAEPETSSENLADLTPEGTDPPVPTEEASTEEPAETERLTLRRPPLPTEFSPREGTGEGTLWANAFQYNAPVFEAAQVDADVLGTVRRGTSLPVGERVFGPGCRGRWYRLGSGYICTSEGFIVGEERLENDQKEADFTGPMPYRYAAVTRRDGALRFFRPPNGEEQTEISRAAESEQALPEVVSKEMVGDYFVALDRQEEDWHRTVRGRYVNGEELNELTTPLLVGARLTGAVDGDVAEGALALPVAFVFAEDRTLFRIENGVASEVGTAEKYARFHMDRLETIDGVEYAVGEGNLAVRRDEVRLARQSAPDERVEGNDWIHVDLAQQVLVAYEDRQPVYATMVASGREGYDTPRGVFKIREKYISTTMDGTDPVDGDFEVEEVPWTMFYWRSFALHGAYWHDDFGRVRSHGCTNIAPADARWLFEWTGPHLPAGWHGYRMKRRGTWVWLSRGDAEYDPPQPEE